MRKTLARLLRHLARLLDPPAPVGIPRGPIPSAGPVRPRGLCGSHNKWVTIDPAPAAPPAPAASSPAK